MNIIELLIEPNGINNHINPNVDVTDLHTVLVELYTAINSLQQSLHLTSRIFPGWKERKHEAVQSVYAVRLEV